MLSWENMHPGREYIRVILTWKKKKKNNKFYYRFTDKKFFSARGIYYLTTNARKPYAQGFPGKKRPAEGDSRTAKNKRAKPRRLRRN